jgi:hypothetical protein
MTGIRSSIHPAGQKGFLRNPTQTYGRRLCVALIVLRLPRAIFGTNPRWYREPIEQPWIVINGS